MSTETVITALKENENPLVQEIPLDRIRPSAANPRGSIDATSLAELAASIGMHGVLQPILVRPAPTWGYEIICGERRWRASLKVKRETIPARIVNLSNSEALEYATVENLLREDIHPLEEAASYEKLLAMNPSFTPTMVSERVGKSSSHVFRRLQLLKLDPKLKQLFFDGHMTAAHALILARLQPSDQKEVLSQLNQASKKGAIEFPSVARLQEWVESEIYLDLNGAPFSKDDANLLPEAGPCTTCPKRTGFNPSLFPEVKQKETCTDRGCFQRKLTAFVETKVKEAPPDTVKISTAWRFAGETKPEGVLTRDEYRESKKGACENTVRGIVAAGEGIGTAKWVCVTKGNECPVHGASFRSIGESAEAKAERLKRESEARLELKRRRAVFDAIREKARQERSLDLDDFRLITREFYHRLPFDTAKQFVILNGYISPAVAKKRKIEPSGADTGNDYASHFEKLVDDADLNQLAAWLVELALIIHRDHAPYSYHGDGAKSDPLFDAASRWGLEVESIKASVIEQPKLKRSQKDGTS